MFYFSLTAGWAGATTSGSVLQTGSAGVFDPTALNSFNPVDSGFAGGVSFGFLVPTNIQTPIRFTEGFASSWKKKNISFSIEGGITGFSGVTSTQPGIPGGPFGTATGSDSITFRDNWVLTASGVLDVPVTPNIDFIGKVGFALVNKTVNLNCATFCNITPATANFSDSQTKTLPGLLVGGEIRMPFALPGFSGASVGVGYDHIFTQSTDMTLGTLPTRLVGVNLSQDIDMVSARITIPLNSPEPFLRTETKNPVRTTNIRGNASNLGSQNR